MQQINRMNKPFVRFSFLSKYQLTLHKFECVRGCNIHTIYAQYTKLQAVHGLDELGECLVGIDAVGDVLGAVAQDELYDLLVDVSVGK